MRTVLTALLLLPAPLLAAEEGGARAPEPLGAGHALQVVFALLLVLALIFAMAWLIRRFGHLPGSGGTGPLRVLASLSVGQRERVVLVQVGERQLLLGVGPGRVQTLHVLEEPLALDTDSGERFADRFAAAVRKRGGAGQ